MNTYTQGTLRKKQAPYKTQDGTRKRHWVWQMVITYKDAEGKQHVRRKDTAIECSPDSKDRKRGTKTKATGKGSDRALQELAAWRQSLIEEDRKAEEEAKAAAEAKAEEERRAKDPANGLLCDYVDAYITKRERGAYRSYEKLEESTVRAYRGSARYIREAWPHRSITSITKDDVLALQDFLINEELLSASTVRKVHRLLTLVYGDLLDREIVTKDPMRNVKPPRMVPKNPNAYSIKDVPVIAERLAALPNSNCIVAANLALFAGLRRGEICALQWQDVDLAEDTITVRRAIGTAAHGTYQKETKTNKERTVPIPRQLHGVLSSWRRERREEAMGLGVSDISRLFVVGKEDGTYSNPIVISRQWTELAKALGIKGTEGTFPTLHDLRHTYAGASLSAGVDFKTVSSNLGHANAAMTLNVYATADPKAKRESARKIDAVFTPSPAKVLTLRTGTEDR